MHTDPLASEHSPKTGDSIVGRRFLARLIDDGLLLAAALILVIAASEILGESGTLDSSPFGSTKDGVVALIVALVAAGLFAVYARWAAHRPGALADVTLGRAVARLRIVDGAGLTPQPSLLIGREFIRAALVGAALGVLNWVVQPVTTAIQTLGASTHPHTFGAAIPAALIGLPGVLVTALWCGTALVDSRGRAPHDRLARTRVVAA